MALPHPSNAIPTGVDAQLSLGFMEVPALTSHLWHGLPTEQRAAAVTALARLIAKTVNLSEEDDCG